MRPDLDIFCRTCGESPDMDAPHTGNWDDYGHSDPAHYPNWYPQAPIITEDDES